MARKFVKRRYRRRGNVAKRHPTMKAVAKRVVKTALSRQVERKSRIIQLADKQIKGTVVHWLNPLYYIPKGDQSYERLGDKLTNPRLELSLSYFHEGLPYGTTTDSSWLGSKLRVVVFKTRQQLTPDDADGWTDSIPGIGAVKNLFLNDYQGSFSHLNRHDYTIMYDRTVSSMKPFYTSYPSFGPPGQLRTVISLGKEFRYTGMGANDIAGTAWGTHSNIYLAVVASGVNSSDVDKMGRLQCTYRISWTDA
ncbi:MAG: capsid protein [Cressdnaviricota sp.]|nr:MAG: capsid protein [Cressdnaviricota sp.]